MRAKSISFEKNKDPKSALDMLHPALKEIKEYVIDVLKSIEEYENEIYSEYGEDFEVSELDYEEQENYFANDGMKTLANNILDILKKK